MSAISDAIAKSQHSFVPHQLGNNRNMIIDSHAHFVPPRLLEAIRDMNSQFPSIELIKGGENNGFSFAGHKSTRPVSKLLSDTAGRLDWMNTNGIDMQVIGGWLTCLAMRYQPMRGNAGQN